MTTDFRALCVELTEFVARLTKHYYAPAELLTRARAALADKPAVPTVMEIVELSSEIEAAGLGQVDFARAVLARWGNPAPVPAAEGEVAELMEGLRLISDGMSAIGHDSDSWFVARAAELLQRLSPPQPVPVSERLPEPEDCDAEGRCWLLTVEDEYPQWRLHSIQDAQPGGAMIWVPVDSSPGVMVDCFYTSHWLPAHALPVPEVGQ